MSKKTTVVTKAHGAKMRILLGPGVADPKGNEAFLVRALREVCELRTFGVQQADVRFDPAVDSFPDVLKRLGGWKPRAVIIRDAEYYPLPVGIEEAPVPTVALVGDWNVCYSNYSGLLRHFDLILTDRPGVERLLADGFQDVRYFPLYGFDPDLHRSDERNIPRYDVAVVANLNHDIHQRRARFLYRLASLPARYRIRIDTGLYDEAYVSLLRASELVFNCSVRGELNMRAFEAPACGAVLLLESDNAEVDEFFQNGEHLILYDESNFEDVVEEALADRERLARIRENMFEALRGHSYAERARSLVQVIQGSLADLRDRSAKRSSRASWKDWLRYYVGMPHLSCLKAAEKLLVQHVQEDPVHNWTYASVLARLFQYVPPERRSEHLVQVLKVAQKAAKVAGPSWMGAYNLGVALLNCGVAREAASFLDMARRYLSLEDPLFREGFVFTGSYNSVRIRWEKAWTDNAGNEEDRYKACEKVLRWHIHHLLGELAFRDGRTEDAARFWLEAIRAAPDAAETRHYLACAQWKLGQQWAAYENLRQCLEINPFHFPAWFDGARMLAGLGRWEELEKFVRERLIVVRRIPPYAEVGHKLSVIWRNLRAQAEGASVGVAAT